MTKHVNFDYQRASRTGIPEVIYSESKPIDVQLSLLNDFAVTPERPALFTRLNRAVFEHLDPSVQEKFSYDPIARTAFNSTLGIDYQAKVAVISAGTSDAPVTWEAARTLEYLNIKHTVFEDCGVAGLWRIQNQLEAINAHQILIAVAGMEAALVGVLSGLTRSPIIGVPTSVGYGVCQNGMTALQAMLACCSPGVSVVNIDNGFGAACNAYKIISSMERH